jgi:hypothetical protein
MLVNTTADDTPFKARIVSSGIQQTPPDFLGLRRIVGRIKQITLMNVPHHISSD